MNSSTPSPAAQRLERLAAFLREDPSNPALLADACDAAIACGAHDRAEDFIKSGERLAADPAQWTFRRARLAMARNDLTSAAQTLEGLLASGGPHPVLAHDLAYVRLLQGDAEAGRALLQPWMDQDRTSGLPADQQQALQVLWLRARHRLERLEDALEWARARLQQGTLFPAAQGVASLVALDLDDQHTALAMADAALAADPAQLEALVARGSIALSQGEVPLAKQLLELAVTRHPADGRARGVLGLVNLHEMDLPSAQAHLERAAQAMPDDADTRNALGWARLLQGDRAGAVEAFGKSVDINAESAETHAAMGLALAMGGEESRSRTHLDHADRLDPRNATARFARGVLAGATGEPRSLEAVARELRSGGGLSGRLRQLLSGAARRRN